MRYISLQFERSDLKIKPSSWQFLRFLHKTRDYTVGRFSRLQQKRKKKRREREKDDRQERNRRGKSKESTDDCDDVHANLVTRSLLLSFRPSSAIPRVPLSWLFEVNPTRNTGCPLASESVSRSPKPLCHAGCLRAHRHARSRLLRCFNEPQFSRKSRCE